MKTGILLTSLIVTLPLVGMAQPDDRQARREEAPPRQGWRGGEDEQFRGPMARREPGFRGEFGPGPRARQGAPDELERGPRPRRCPNCGWSPMEGPPRGQSLGRDRDLPPRQFRPGAGGPPAWAPRDGEFLERPGYGPHARGDDEEPPFRGRGLQRGRPEREPEAE